MRAGDWRQLGVADDEATVRFGEARRSEGAPTGPRVLMLNEAPAFELSFWCGTCPFLFQRQEGASATVSLAYARDRLAKGLDDVDERVIAAFGDLLGADDYLPLLLRLEPTLVEPLDRLDYFSHEEVATWGRNGFYGLPEHPRTPYYRTFSTAVDVETHLYEFVVPMVPPSWNDEDRVRWYVEQMSGGAEPTAVAVASLDVCQPAMDAPSDYYAHWGLTHFLLDGHHKFEAAARVGAPVTLLSLVARGGSLADAQALERLLHVRRQMPSARPDPT